MIDADVESVDLDGRVEHLSQHQALNHSILANQEKSKNAIEDGNGNRIENENEDHDKDTVRLKVKREMRLK